MSAWPTDVIDSHMHQWDPYVTRRAHWLEARLLRPLPSIPRALGRLAPLADREFGRPQDMLKPYLPRDYAADTGSVPVGRVVHIEADWPARRPLHAVEETTWISGLPFGVEGAPDLGAIVVHADPRHPDVGAVLDAHRAASHLVRGVRAIGSHHPDPGIRDFSDEPAVFASPTFLEGFAAIAERDLSFEVWCYSHQLPDVQTLARAYPETTFVLNHYGTPAGLFGPRGRLTGRTPRERTLLMDRWREDVSGLAECRNVVAKHSGLGMPVLGDPPRKPRAEHHLGDIVDHAAPLVRHLHHSFGPDRTMWGSNYPIDKPGLTLPSTIRVITEILGDDVDLDRLLGAVARRVYRLDHVSTTQDIP